MAREEQGQGTQKDEPKARPYAARVSDSSGGQGQPSKPLTSSEGAKKSRGGREEKEKKH